MRAHQHIILSKSSGAAWWRIIRLRLSSSKKCTTGCGSGVITDGEECEDGNDADGDGIPDDCTGGGCTGDSNGDDRIDGADLTELLGAWGSDDPDFDLDGNGLVDGGDLTLLLGNWGQCR